MRFDDLQADLRAHPQRWLVTGAAGFIGSHLAQRLLDLGQEVVGLDNLSTGHMRNLDDMRRQAGAHAHRFRFVKGDIRDRNTCHAACANVDRVLHHAGLDSEARSVTDPLTTHQANVDGFLHMLIAARDAGVRRFVYASSSAVYGDDATLPRREGREGRLLSPAAATKRIGETYAQTFQDIYGIECIGLRYFDVFGPRQEAGALVPRFIQALLAGRPCEIPGDGSASLDLCYVEDAVQANLLAAMVDDAAATNQAYNVASGEGTTVRQVFELLRASVSRHREDAAAAEAKSVAESALADSLADIGKAGALLGYEATHGLASGIDATVDWHAAAGAPRRAIG